MRADRRRVLYATSAIVMSRAVVVNRCSIDVEKKDGHGQASRPSWRRSVMCVPEPHT